MGWEGLKIDGGGLGADGVATPRRQFPLDLLAAILEDVCRIARTDEIMYRLLPAYARTGGRLGPCRCDAANRRLIHAAVNITNKIEYK